MAEVKFDRTPYLVQYKKDGKTETIRRRPPPKLHQMLPKDVVTISERKNDYWDEDKSVTIKSITNRQPNTLQVEDDNGKRTFLDYDEVIFNGRDEEDGLDTESAARASDPIGSKYLLWP